MKQRDFRNPPRPKSRARILLILLILVLISMVGCIIVSRKRWESTPPIAKLDREFKALGRNPAVSLTVQDPGSGLQRLSVVLKQSGKDIPLVTEEYPGPGFFSFWKLGDQQEKKFDIGKL